MAWEFNGLGQLTFEWQSHAGAVGVGTPKAQYAYNFNGSGTVNQSRLTSVSLKAVRSVAGDRQGSRSGLIRGCAMLA
jgi:hypothetical protein